MARLGFGVDYQYAARYPGALKGLCDKYRDQLSHVSVVSVPDDTAARQFVQDVAQTLPVIHHLSGVAPADPTGPHLERMATLDSISGALGALWCCEDVGIWSIGPYAIPYFAPPPFDADVADLIGERIISLAAKSSVPFLAEVPSCSFVAGQLGLGAFFQRIVATAGCSMVLDVSHVFSYALERGLAPLDVLASLPLHSVREFHVAGGRIDTKYSYRYIDSHSHPILADVEMLFVEAVQACPNLQAVTFEIGVGLDDATIRSEVERIEQVLMKANFQPDLGHR